MRYNTRVRSPITKDIGPMERSESDLVTPPPLTRKLKPNGQQRAGPFLKGLMEMDDYRQIPSKW